MNTIERDDEQWYIMLIDRYTPYVTVIVSGISKGALTAGDIEEVAADVFFKIWRSQRQPRRGKQSLQGGPIIEADIKAFIAQIARNATVDKLRKLKMEFVPYDDDVLSVSYPQQLDDLAIVREQKQIVENAVNSFGEPDREIFIRFYYWGESIKAISDRLNLNMSTTKTKLHRLRSKLRDTMQERGYGCE